jgi:Lrp/AsnC family transcriptional regulator, regulator for asnA, asnC and gidA
MLHGYAVRSLPGKPDVFSDCRDDFWYADGWCPAQGHQRGLFQSVLLARFACIAASLEAPVLGAVVASRGRTDVEMSRMVSTTDRLLIRLLQQNARISFAELSRVTGIPESTVRRRVERLQDRGIVRFAMIAEADQLGYDISAIIGLRIDLARLEEIGSEVAGMSEVVFASFLTGSFDIMAQIVVESQPKLVDLLTRIARIEGVRSTETFLMPRVLKPMTAWVIPQPDDDLDRDPLDASD